MRQPETSPPRPGYNSGMFHVVALILGGVALVGLLVALYADRSRGRRRCPRCWFDLSSHGRELTCSECGRTQPHEGRMYLTRRHWKWAVLCVAGLIAARATWEYPAFKAAGAPAYAPTWAVRRFMAHLPALGPEWTARLDATLTPNTTQQEWKDVIERCLSILEDADASPEAHALAARVLARIQLRGYFATAASAQWANQFKINDLGEDGIRRATRALTRALASDDPALRRSAAECLENLNHEAAAVGLPRLIASLRAPAAGESAAAWTGSKEHTPINAMLDNPEPVRKALIDDGDTPLPSRIAPLAAIDAETSDADRERIIVALLDDADARVRVLAYWMLGFVKVSDPAAIVARAGQDAQARAMAPWLAKRFELPGDNLLALARGMLDDQDAAARGAGIDLLASIGDNATTLVPRLLEIIKDDPAWYVRRNAAMALAKIKGVDQATLAAAAQAVVLDPQEDVQMYAGGLLKRLGDGGASLVPILIPRVADASISVGGRMKVIETLAIVGSESGEAHAAILAVALTPAKPPQARYAALRVLPMFATQKDATIAAITPLLKDEDSTLRRSARSALEKLGVVIPQEGETP